MSTVRAMLPATTTGRAATSHRHHKSMLGLHRRSRRTRVVITSRLRRSSRPSRPIQPTTLRTHHKIINRITTLTQHTTQPTTRPQAHTIPTSKPVVPTERAMRHLARLIRTILSQVTLATAPLRTWLQPASASMNCARMPGTRGAAGTQAM